MIYFDNAATSFPKPESALRAATAAMRRYGANPGRSGHFLSMRAAQEVFDTRENVAEYFHAKGPELVAFTLNATYALNMVIKGVLRPGDHVIISCLEHNAVARTMEALTHMGVGYSVAPVVFGDDEKTVESFKTLIRPETRAIVCTLASNVCGYVLPFRKIGALAHERGLLMIADGAQAAGYREIDVQQDNLDFLCLPGHKGLYGTHGVGLIVVNCLFPLATLIEGGTGSQSKLLTMPEDYPERLECGTVNLPAIAALNAGVHFLRKHPEAGPREMRIWRYLAEGLSVMPHVTLQPIAEEGAYVPLLSFWSDKLEPNRIEEELSSQGVCVRSGLHCAPLAHNFLGTGETGTVRLSLGAFNTRAQAEEFLKILNKIIK